MLKRLLKRALYGRRYLQRLFALLYRISLRGMNIGGGSDVGESGELNVLKHIALFSEDRNFTVFDVGANVGDYTMLVISEFRGHASVHAFEPARQTFIELQRRCGTVARVNNFGLSDAATSVPLYATPERSGLASVYKRDLDHLDLPMNASETISLRTLDDYCDREAIARIDLLKLDVEGHELAVLRGARSLLDRGAIGFIQFEFGGCNIDSRTYFRDFYHLLSPRYRLYRVLSRGLWPIESYDESLEAFSTTNYLAVRRDLEFHG
jgi:FkbM family methyltransferase